ncbi:MAG: hypothetical protein RIQ53_1731 [Pseudomonadota bacterium]|jgi:AraC-like DNA-binding protein
MHIIATAQYRLKTLTLHQPALVQVVSGEKRVIAARQTVRGRPRQALLLAGGTQWDVVNDPARQARYAARCVGFDDEVLAQAAPLLRGVAAEPVRSARVLAVDEALAEAIDRLDPQCQRTPPSPLLQRHRQLELLLLLAERGWMFEPPGELGWAQRVRRLVGQRPDGDWRVEQVAVAFHTSPSSLRRRLLDEGVTVAAIVREVRLELALGLLQGGQLSVGEVAQRCGWASHSRFTAMFQQRWGVRPSVVRAVPVPTSDAKAGGSAQIGQALNGIG